MNYAEDSDGILMALEEIMPDAIVLIPFASRHLRMSFCILALIATMPNGSRNDLYCLNDHRRVLCSLCLFYKDESIIIDMTTATKSIYNVIKFFQELFHEEHCYPHSKSPTLEANRVAICNYLLDEGRVLYLTILYKYYSLIYKIRLHLLHLQLDSDDVLSSLDSLPCD